jgi:hypothetical protein
LNLAFKGLGQWWNNLLLPGNNPWQVHPVVVAQLVTERFFNLVGLVTDNQQFGIAV